MTPALLSGAVGAMSLVSASRAEPARFVPVYFVPGRPGAAHRPPAMVPDTVLSGIAEPKSIISEVGRPDEQGLAFEGLTPIPAIAQFDGPPSPWRWLTGGPGGGGGGDQISTSAVPEPATWAMLTGGFMLAGGILRRRRRIVAATAH